MNNLSWLIYFADVADRVQGAFTFIAVMLGIFLVILIPVWIVNYPGGMNLEQSQFCKRLVIILCILFPLFTTIALFAPSSKAIYLIAGSEIGEQIVTNPEAIEMFNDIKDIVKKELKELK